MELLTARELAHSTNNTVSEGFIRSAFFRDEKHHPLPSVKFGKARPIRKTTIDAFEQWMKEELGQQ